MRRAFLTTLVLAAPRVALACPVCFGQTDSPLARAMNSGILFMLGIVAIVLAAFASFFICLIRRAKLAEQIGPAEGGARAGHHVLASDPQEGIVSC